jgi:hypothetical protein
MIRLSLAVALLFLVGPAVAGGPKPAPGPKLWAALTVPQPVFEQGNLGPGFFQVNFAVVNDGDQTVDPGIGESKLLVNGKEMKDWNFIIHNGPRGTDFTALEPGKAVRFGSGMGRYFDEPGVYRLVWKGKHFEAPEVVFRVLPKPAG